MFRQSGVRRHLEFSLKSQLILGLNRDVQDVVLAYGSIVKRTEQGSMYSIGFVEHKLEQRRCLSIQEGIMSGPGINSKSRVTVNHKVSTIG